MQRHRTVVQLMVVVLPNNSELIDRTLWFDGDSTVSVDYIIDAVLLNTPIESFFVKEYTDEIIKYNNNVNKEQKLYIKTDINEMSFDWDIPEEFKQIDVIEYILDKLSKVDGNEPDFAARQARCDSELELYSKLNLFSTIQMLIYVVDTFEKQNIVWGVGRGSSVSSYILYLIGIHDVDSFKYGLDIEEFLRS